MIIYFTLLFAVFLVAYLTEKRKGAAGLFLFLILGTFSAVRDGIGVDYGGYLLHIERIFFFFLAIFHQSKDKNMKFLAKRYIY